MAVLRPLLWLAFLSACRVGFEPWSADGGAGSGSRDASGDARGDATPHSCGAAYAFSYGNSRYRYAGTDMWVNSELDCEADGAGMHLVVMDDAAEAAALAPLTGGTQTWIGASDRITVGTWRLVTGVAASYLPWAVGQPAALPCVSWDPASGQLSAEDCAIARGRVCECDGVLADKTSY